MGIKDNNPGNIRKGENWKGMVESDGEFVEFESPEYGIRAITKILQTYSEKYNINTLEEIFNRYAPDTENDTDTYIKNMSSFTGFDSNETLNLQDPDTLAKIIKGITKQENPGKNHYSDKIIYKGIEMAGIEKKDNQSFEGTTSREDGRKAVPLPMMKPEREDGREAVPFPMEKPIEDDTQKMLINEESLEIFLLK